MKRRLAGMLSAFLFLLLVPWAGAAELLSMTDTAGRLVRVPYRPERIVCLGPGTLRLIVYLQAQDLVAGVEEMEKRNPRGRPYWLAHGGKLEKLPTVGPGGPASINKKPDMERVLAVRPQVVFITYMDADLADRVQAALGIPVVILSYGRFASFDEAVLDSLKLAGAILGREARARQVEDYVHALRSDLDRRTRTVAEERRPSAYVGGIGYRGGQGILSTELDYVPFAWTHTRNAARDVPTRLGTHVFLDREKLLELDPEVIFLDGGGLELVRADSARHPAFYQTLRAFKNRKVYRLFPFNFYTTNVETALVDAYAVGKVLYPDRFTDVDLARKADEIFSFFVGSPVYGEMAKDFGVPGAEIRF